MCYCVNLFDLVVINFVVFFEVILMFLNLVGIWYFEIVVNFGECGIFEWWKCSMEMDLLLIEEIN